MRVASRPVGGRAVQGHAEGVLQAARAHLGYGGGVLLTGPPGIGKSTLLGTLAAEHTGHRVFHCSPAESERDLPFLGLIDLLSGAADEVLDRLPAPEREMLRSALLLQDTPVQHRDVLCLRLAVLDSFRLLCAELPGLLVIDDVQWLDGPTAELLAFVARRAARLDPPLKVLAGLRTETPPAAPPGLCPAPVLTLQVPPMRATDLAPLLASRYGRSWPRSLVTQIHEVSGGNPFYALELARSIEASGVTRAAADPLPIPDSLAVLIRERLAALSPGSAAALLVASAAGRPSADLLRAAGRPAAEEELAEAETAGIVAVAPGGRVRFTHPLLSAVIYAEAPPADRAAAHAALAEVVQDPVERALHLARVTPGRDARIAAQLDEAARAARRRGALSTAARLGELAADHSPGAAPGTRTPAEPAPGVPGLDGTGGTGRRLRAAEDAVAAGEWALARRLAHAVLEVATEAAERVRAWTVVLDSSGQALAEVDDVFPQALDDAQGDPALLAQLYYRLSWRSWIVQGSAEAAQAHVARSAELAGRAGDRRTELMALSQQANIELFLGRQDAELTLRRALAEPQDPRVMWDHNGPVYLKHRHHLLNDRLNEARAELRALMYTVRQRGAMEGLGLCLYSLSQVEIMHGRCGQALSLARQGLSLAEDTGLSQGPFWFALAHAEAAGGDLDRALLAAERARQHSEDDGDLLFLPRALHAEGLVRLQLGEAAAAVEILREVRRLDTAQGLGDPAMRRWHADLAEALVATGRADEAERLITETRRAASRLGRVGVLAVLHRAAALVTAARGDVPGASLRLRRAAELLQSLPYRLEEGRAWLALGTLTGDQPALRQARRVFTRAHAGPWLARATAELDGGFGGGFGGGRERPGPVREPVDGVAHTAEPGAADPLERLSDVERKVAVLVAQGATNREIAAKLFLSVKTVEAALTRTFRKLGVRSRVDVARVTTRRG